MQEQKVNKLSPTLSTLEDFIFGNDEQMKDLKFIMKDREKIDFIVGVSRGGLIPAALIATRLDIPLVSVYVNKKDNYSISCDHLDWLENKRICIIDDVIRSGKTMEDIIQFFAAKNIESLSVFVLFKHPFKYTFDEKIIKCGVCPHLLKENEGVEFLWDMKLE